MRIFRAIVISIFLSSPFLFKRRGYQQLPVTFSERGDPLIEVVIEKKPHIFEIDSGGGCYFSIQKELLTQMHPKEKISDETSYDFKGNQYTLSQYILPEIRIGKSIISNVPVIEESVDFLLKGSAWNPSQMSEKTKKELLLRKGRIGASVLRAFPYWLFDFPNSNLVMISDVKKIKNLTEFSRFTEVKLEDVEPHILIEVQTELGPRKFILDTGCNHSMLRYPPDASKHFAWFTFDQFLINGIDFGSIKFRLFGIYSEFYFHFDGILGVDFFKKRQIYFDFPNKKAYIGPTIEGALP